MIAEEYLDKIIIQCDVNNNGDIDIYPILSNLIGHDVSLFDKDDNDLLKEIDRLLIHVYSYAVSTSIGYHYYKFTELGLKAKKSGGHFAYQKQIKKLDRIEIKSQWRASHPLLVELRTIIITAVVTGCISILVSLYLFRQEHQSQYLINTKQDSLLRGLRDSVIKFQSHK